MSSATMAESRDETSCSPLWFVDKIILEYSVSPAAKVFSKIVSKHRGADGHQRDQIQRDGINQLTLCLQMLLYIVSGIFKNKYGRALQQWLTHVSVNADTRC